MKIATLLSQYFYSTKRLDIPAIGSFILEKDPLPIPEDHRQTMVEGVVFNNNRSVKESPELVEYISQHTGKIKALAAADLESFWEQARQFLHIGKPFIIEGIGSLSKMQSGNYSFTPGTLLHEKMMEHVHKELNDATEETDIDYKGIFYNKKAKGNKWKRPVVILLFVAGLGAAIWGGYLLSLKKTDNQTGQEPSSTQKEVAAPVTDSMRVNKDTSLTVLPQKNSTIPTSGADTVLYKYVVETAQKSRALKRYQFLRSNGIAVQMETTDSSNFRLYFSLRTFPADTSKVLDSLQRFYTPPGKKAFIQ